MEQLHCKGPTGNRLKIISMQKVTITKSIQQVDNSSYLTFRDMYKYRKNFITVHICFEVSSTLNVHYVFSIRDFFYKFHCHYQCLRFVMMI